MSTPEDVLSFWFGAHDDPAYPQTRSALWWGKDPETDADIRARFGPLLDRFAEGGLRDWATSARGTLALVVLLDQLTRNMHRDGSGMYALDHEAQDLVLKALDRQLDRDLLPQERAFLFMPLMHAENRALQRLACRLFTRDASTARPADRAGADNMRDYAEKHRVIVERFGRFPHRNSILGRESTPEEQAFLAGPDSSF